MQFSETFPKGHPRSTTSSQSSHSSRRPVPTPQSSSPLAPLPKTTLKLQKKPESPQKTTGGLKKSKSVQAKNALKTIANPIKTRREEKARRYNQEMKEREEAERNVQDFLATGRIYCQRNFS